MSRSNLAVVGVSALFLVALGIQHVRAVGADDQPTDSSVSLAKRREGNRRSSA